MEKEKKGTAGSDDRKGVATEVRERTFTCNGDGCLVTERAEEMFNLSCDPLRTSIAELRQKARCRRCAEQIATKRNKRLGEPGCGVYPLGQTLRTIERGAGAVPAGVDTPSYDCAETGCGSKGPAQEMYNLQASLTTVEVEALKPLIRCRRCALKVASSRGAGLCEPGSGVYRLSHTLRRIGGGPVRSLQEQNDNDYLKWVLETKAVRERAERESRIKAYAVAYAESPLLDELSPKIAKPQPHGDGEQHFCGIPVDCCRHDAPVHRYMAVMGEVVGVCDLAARVFIEVHKDRERAHGEDQRYRRLLSTADVGQAQDIAARWFGREGHGGRRSGRGGA